MEVFFRIAGLCLIGSVLAAFLKSSRAEWGVLLSLAVCGAGIAALIGPVGELLVLLEEMAGRSGLKESLFTPLLRIVGLSVAARLGAELCRDAGESAAAAVVEIGSCVAALLLTAPLFREIWELLRTLL
jgi:stage III sporulation protein AD